MNRLILPILPTLLIVASCSTTPVPAPPPTPTLSLALERLEEGAPTAEEAGAEEERNDLFNAFIGGASNSASESGLAYGVDYEHKFSPMWGAGVFVEGASGDLRSFVGGALAFFHPIEPLAIVAGPALEREEGTHLRSADWNAVLRLGTFYEFPIGNNMTIAPAIYYDISEGENTFIYGVNFGTSL